MVNLMMKDGIIGYKTLNKLIYGNETSSTLDILKELSDYIKEKYHEV